MTLYLIRHALPEYPAAERMCLGSRIDLPLSRVGQEQALALSRAFNGIKLDAVYHSPLKRAAQTARALYKPGRKLVLLDELKELDGGEWDGLTFGEIRKRYPGASLPPPGGETDESGLLRAKSALDRIACESRGDAAAVSHSALNRTLLCAISGMPFSDKRLIKQPYACVNILINELGQWRAVEMGIPLTEWALRTKTMLPSEERLKN